jgi:hypothetical protein
MNELDRTSSQPFGRRAIRVLAVVCLGYAALDLVQLGTTIANVSYRQSMLAITPFHMGWLYDVATALAVGGNFMLLAGSIGLLMWKRWARRCLLFGAVVNVLSCVLLPIVFILYYWNVYSLRGRTLGVWEYAQSCINVIIGSMRQAIVSLLVAWLMLQREVREFLSVSHGHAFAVISLDPPAGEESQI